MQGNPCLSSLGINSPTQGQDKLTHAGGTGASKQFSLCLSLLFLLQFGFH